MAVDLPPWSRVADADLPLVGATDDADVSGALQGARMTALWEVGR
jgi:hypothetical protein